MGYTTITFLIFTLLVVAAYYMFPVKKYQWTVLLAASYVFYLWASWRYVIFILITTYTVYFAALAMYRNIKEAKETGIVNIKGHRTVGGMRASIYNAMPLEGVEALIAFMKKFEEENYNA